MKWSTVLRESMRDAILMGFGGWLIWSQVYAASPNGYLILVGFGLMVPSARTAVISILSEHGSSSSSSPPPQEPPSLPGSSSAPKETEHED